MVKICTLRRKRRHPKETKNGQKFAQKWSKFAHTKQKKEKEEKKSRTFPLLFVCTTNAQRERERRVRRKKKDEQREHQRQTNDDERTATNRGGEVREGVERAESGRVREGALLFFLLLNSFRRHHHFRWLCVLNHDDVEISSRSIRALSSRFSAATTARQKPKRVYFYTR